MQNVKIEELKKTSPSTIDKYVGSRLRTRRVMLGMRQNDIGQMLGVTFQQVQKYEKGLNKIGAGRLYILSKLLNVKIDYFFDGYEDSEDGKANAAINNTVSEGGEVTFRHEEILNKDVINLVRAFNKIKNSNIRRSVIKLVGSITGKTSIDDTVAANDDEEDDE